MTYSSRLQFVFPQHKGVQYKSCLPRLEVQENQLVSLGFTRFSILDSFMMEKTRGILIRPSKHP